MTPRPQAVEKRRRGKVWSDGAGALRLRVLREVSYSVLHTAQPVFDRDEPALAEMAEASPVLFIADAAVAQIYGEKWRDYAVARGLDVAGELVLPISEALKVWEQVDGMCSYAARCGLPRNGLIVAIGGGVLLDAAGLAAAVFRRGIGYIRIPTTLVGMIDVAVGIKQAVNAYGKKNLIGAFYPPVASINDYSFLQTLPAGELVCGMAEIIKMALIRDASLFEMIEKHGRELVFSRFGSPIGIGRKILLRSERLMMQELAPNLFEEEHARLVDFGHTFSPAIEVSSGYQIPHGQAVAIDMLLSVSIAVARGIANPDVFTRLLVLLRKLGLQVIPQLLPDRARLFAALNEARRHRGGCLNLVVIESPGRPQFLQDVSRADIESACETLLAAAAHNEAAVNRSRCVGHGCSAV